MRRGLIGTALFVAALLPWLAPTVATADPQAAATTTASASSSASAAPTATPLADAPLPAEASEIPDREGWKGARAVTLDGPLPPQCRAHLVREWLRLRCTGPPGEGSVVSGPSEDVVFYVAVPNHPEIPHIPNPGRGTLEVILPLRRGVSRLVQLTDMTGGGYDWFAQAGLVLLSVQWPKSQERPQVLTDVRRWNDEDVLGMRVGGVEEAEKLDLPTKWGGPIILEVEPGSPADRGGAEPGDVISGLEDDWHGSLAFGGGPVDNLLVQRKGTAKQVYLPRRPSAKRLVRPR
jgi:hypothetical protein